MDEISNKALNIGVAIFITIIITSGVFYVINQIKNIYGQVYNTDIALQNNFSEFDSYENTKKTGIDVLNAVKKYLDDPHVIVEINGENIGTTSAFYTNYKNKVNTDELDSFLSVLGTKKYSSTVSDDNGVTTIIFKSI